MLYTFQYQGFYGNGCCVLPSRGPESAIDHPFKLKNNGEVFIAKADVGAGQQLQPGRGLINNERIAPAAVGSAFFVKLDAT